MGEFQGRTAIVTAAANGIGRAVALLLAAESARLILIDIESNRLAETVEEARALGSSVESAVVDCTSHAAVADSFGRFGPVDILVNGVGSSARERSCRFVDSQPEVWDFVHQVTLVTAMLCSRQVVSGMQQRRYGRIVNISSDAALRPPPMTAEYAAAKAGVIGFTRALAAEFGAHGITVNVVAPALISTRTLDVIPRALLESAKAEIPLGRVGTPEEVAYAIAFLASERASFITGQTLAVNGGRSFV
jgi:NAD(P)-dependent dehydrogenase (short-subunit alcohol dehydrogenase family)